MRRTMRRTIALMLVVVPGAFCAGNGAVADAAPSAVSNLATGVLHSGDVPGGFSNPTYQVFRSYVVSMKVSGRECSTPTTVTRKNWKQGLNEVSLKGKEVLEVCGFALTTSGAAKSVYQQALLESKRFKPKTVAIGESAFKFHEVASTLGFDSVYFRHGNAVIQVVHIFGGKRKGSIGLKGLVRLAGLINGRLTG